MAVLDMGHLMGDHGLQFGGAFQPQDQAGMQEYMLRIDHKRVQRGVVDHQNTGAETGHARRQQHRLGQFAKRVFDIGVTNQTCGAGGQGGQQGKSRQQHNAHQIIH